MPSTPSPASPPTHHEALRHLNDVAFWAPHVNTIATRHNLPNTTGCTSGVGGTYPTFVADTWVLKLLGTTSGWRAAFEAERATLTLFAQAPASLPVPRLIATGALAPGHPDTPWPYLVISRLPGTSWHRANPSPAHRLQLAAALGRQLALIHTLPLTDAPYPLATPHTWRGISVADAARRTALPPHLIPHAQAFADAHPPGPNVALVHGDLFERHAFTQGPHLTGLIDWGDAIVTDPHYELAKLHLGTFEGDLDLLRAFLRAYGWPISPDFPQRTLAAALRRQAHGLVQHRSMDVFHSVPGLLRGRHMASLDALAVALFGV